VGSEHIYVNTALQSSLEHVKLVMAWYDSTCV